MFFRPGISLSLASSSPRRDTSSVGEEGSPSLFRRLALLVMLWSPSISARNSSADNQRASVKPATLLTSVQLHASSQSRRASLPPFLFIWLLPVLLLSVHLGSFFQAAREERRIVALPADKVLRIAKGPSGRA